MIGHISYNLCSMSGKNHRSLLSERMLSELSQKGQLICLHETVLFVEQVLVSFTCASLKNKQWSRMRCTSGLTFRVESIGEAKWVFRR